MRTFRSRSRIGTSGPRPSAAGSVRRHEDRQAEPGEMVQRLVDADQRPEPRMLVLHRHAVAGSEDPLDTADGNVNGEVDEWDEPESTSPFTLPSTVSRGSSLPA